MSFSERVEAARLRAGTWWREHKERAAEKRAARAYKPHQKGAPMLWVWFLAIIAAATLVGSTWMLVVFIAGSVGSVDWAVDWRNGSDGVRRFEWEAAANIHLIIGVGLFCFCLGIAAFNAVWLHVRHYLFGIFKNIVTALGVATALFMVAGAIVTQQWGTDARTRDQVEAVNTSLAGVAAINAEIEAINLEMERLCAQNLTTYQAQACRSGELAWGERIATARAQNDYQLPGIERALADARQGDRWRARLLELRQQAAVANVQHVEAEVATVVTQGRMATFARTLEDIRKPFIAVLGELLAMTMFGVALAAWRSRQPNRDVETSGWADAEHRIEDLRGAEVVDSAGRKKTVEPMDPPRTVVTDAETGEELVKVKPHWRKLKKGKKTQVEVQVEDRGPREDERGVSADGGGRIAMSAAGPMDVSAFAAPGGESAQEAHDTINYEEPDAGKPASEISDSATVQPEPPELSDEEALALADELAAEESQQQPDETPAQPEPEARVEQADEDADQRREPETNPARILAAAE